MARRRALPLIAPLLLLLVRNGAPLLASHRPVRQLHREVPRLHMQEEPGQPRKRRSEKVARPAMIATECLRKNVQEYITEHAAAGEAQQQWLCCPASSGVHVWKQRHHCRVCAFGEEACDYCLVGEKTPHACAAFSSDPRT